jgi:hypothetical protein
MQVQIDLPSFVIGFILGSLLLWLYRKSSEDKSPNGHILSDAYYLQRGLFIAYDLLRWFRRPNRRKREKDGDAKEARYYQKLFNYFLNNRYIRKVSEGEDESYCLTEEGKILCSLLDEISEELDIPELR